MSFRLASRPSSWIALALLLVSVGPRVWAKDGGTYELDLQPLLCPLEFQQPNNEPAAGVDFVSDGEVLVYTVCHVNAALSTRAEAQPGADAANHLKAAIVDLSTGSAVKSFDWPTRGRGASVRVTHRGELFVQTDNLLRSVTREGKPISAIRLVKVGKSDLTFVNSSPAADFVAVIQSSEADGKTINGVAVLDAHSLDLKTRWHDDGESWNIAVSGDSALRTQTGGTRVQAMDLAKASDTNTNWNTVWSSTVKSARPLFLGGNRFAFVAGDGVVVLAAPDGSDRKDFDCMSAMGVRASREGGLLAAICVRQAVQLDGPDAGPAILPSVDVYRANPLRKIGSVALDWPPGADFDFALSPSGGRAAVVDGLRLKVYSVNAKVSEPVAVPNVETAAAPLPTDAQMPVVQSSTRLILVDTVATDSHSHSVPDLAASDFTVLENGKPQKIAFFSYESPEKRKGTGAASPLAPGVFTNRPDADPAKPAVVLLLDGLNTPSSQQLYVREQMLKYLTNLKPSNARMAVLALGSDLTVLQDFTTDLSSLQAAVKNYKRGRTRADVETPAIDLPAAMGSVKAPPGAAPPDGTLPGVQDRLAFFSQSVANDEQDVRIRMTVAALQAIAQSVSGYPGRKSLIWMSSSFPFTLGFDNFAFYKEYGGEIRKTTALLADANVAVYPVDAHGLISGGGMADVTTSGASADRSGVPNTDLSAEVFKNFRSDETQNTIAEETGGKVFRNTNDLTGAIQSAVDDSASHYVLGYYLDRKNLDGQFHTIKVKVARNGVHVRSRTGYYALDVNDWREKENQELNAGRLNGLAATGVVFQAQPIQPTAQGQPATVEIFVDPGTISVGDGPDGTYSMDLSFEVAALKVNGTPERVETRSASGDVKATTYRQFLRTGIPMRVEMPLTTGRHLLRVMVRDNRTGHLGTLDLPVTIG